MSKKRILNASSRKKRDGMLPLTNTGATGVPISSFQATQGYISAVNTVNAGCQAFFLWNATARTSDYTSNNSVIQASARTSQTCYIRGLSEHIRVQTSSGLPWFYRRIVFRIKLSGFPVAEGSPLILPVDYYQDTNSIGMRRLLYNFIGANTPNTLSNIQSYLFKGRGGADWNEMIIAPVDTTQVDLMYDKTFTIKSGNAVGTVREFKHWHPCNKNLVYDDDEDGAEMDPSYYSVLGKQGMGNLYVADIFSCGQGATSTDILTFNPTATLYWHEK